MIEFSDVKLFTTKNGKTVSYEDLLRDVYENSEETRESIRKLVEQLTGMMSSPSDAMMIMAHITMMIESRVKNDDLLVKIASILSRLIQKNTGKSEGPDWQISEEERRQLMREVEEVLDRNN